MGVLTDKLSTVWNNAVASIESIPAEVNAKLAQFRNSVSQFESLYSQLQSKSAIARTDPALYADYSAIMNRFANVKSYITDTLAKLGSALGYLKSKIGMGELGEPISLTALAILAGAIAVITSAVVAGNAMNKRLDYQQKVYDDAKARGASPSELSAIAHDAAVSSGGSLFGGAGDLANKAIFILIAGGLLYLFAPTIKKVLEGKK